MTEPRPLLSTIDCPDDLRGLSSRKLAQLALEIRSLIVEVVSKNGGHLASNLGVVELAIALHRVFRSPRDTIIWDVGHQCYAHKILTGRRDAFPSLRTQGGLSGFPRPEESPHDAVQTGHSSTSLSYGLGLLTGRQMKGDEGRVIAVIGDGALTGGLAFAGLNNAGLARRNLIIVLNDNAMSIGRNVGALSAYLGRLTTTRLYQLFRRNFDSTVGRMPFIGGELMGYVVRFKKMLKALFFRETIFADLGFNYVGPIDGHDVRALMRILENLRHVEGPTVVHVTTRKGNGFALAENDPTRFHGISPFSVVDGSVEESSRLTYTEAFSQAIIEEAREDTRILAVTAAMVDGTGLRPFAKRHPTRVFDVGIAEDHAVTFAAGLALSGMRPVVAIYSTFMQRAVDQVIHDVAIPGLPVVFVVDRAGFVSGDGETHQGLFDMALFGGVPGMTILAPASRGEIGLSLRWALSQEKPVMIRYPKAVCGPELEALASPLEEGRGVFVRFLQSEVLLVSVGGLLPETLEAAHLLNLSGISVDIYNLRFVKPIDSESLYSVLRLYRRVVVVEEGMARGGVGEHLSQLMAQKDAGLGTVSVCVRGAPDAFAATGSREQLLASAGLDGAGIASFVRGVCERGRPPVILPQGAPARTNRRA
jgi:1-deoxy-D-xylulose-5-phosphate synthase